MELTGLTFGGYKCFEGEQNLEIRPLTILIGANSSGKSVIARLPLLLGRALSEAAEGPLDLEFEGLDLGGAFADLVHDRLPHAAVRLGCCFAAGKEALDAVFRVRYFEEVRSQIVERVELKVGGKPRLMLRWVGSDPVADAGTYLDDLTGKQQAYEFRGVLPYPYWSYSFDKDLAFLLYQLRDWGKGLHYLGPFRDRPSRDYRWPQSSVAYVGHSGRRAPDLLASDMVRNKREVLDEVAAWYAEHLGGWRLDIAEQGDRFSLVLAKPGNEAVKVNLMDVGIGIAQVLPLVVQRHFEAARGLAGGLEVIEQPELHLHPQAHGALADLYATAAKNTPTRFIIETHSEMFLLRLRRRIAEGTLDPQKVVFYWTFQDKDGQSRIVRIDIDARGEVSEWPTDVFADAYREVMAIRRLQRGKHT